ncbi:MAG: hypothetical protein M5R36_25165 [Deltaproteobacteria bacterium]|nr:hypothetical protein [Deltaproteobacteria bacterium]
MQTFDMSLMKLVLEKKISYQEALENSSNPGDFALKFKGVSSTSDTDLSEFQRITSEAERKFAESQGETLDEPPGKMVIERFSK